MTRLIDGLLHLTGLSRTEMLPRKVDLGEMASAILDGFRESFPRKPVRFRIDEGLNAFGDPRLLRVMLENLLGNAWKFSLKKETVEIHFGRFEENGETRFFVRDNGAGFDMEYADKLFKVFQRLHSEEEFEGMGIGLATVKRIVNRHAGTIRAKGRVNEGAVFSFTLSLPRE
jgi:light-regulated signal transduction histidine kinase (bacteriophytochrome)